MYFTPASSSWLNLVERFFRDLTAKRIRRAAFRTVEELITAIGDYTDKDKQLAQSRVDCGLSFGVLGIIALALTQQHFPVDL